MEIYTFKVASVGYYMGGKITVYENKSVVADDEISAMEKLFNRGYSVGPLVEK